MRRLFSVFIVTRKSRISTFFFFFYFFCVPLVMHATQPVECTLLSEGGPVGYLNIMRREKFKQRVLKSTVYVDPQTLCPTSSAAKFHSMREYHQALVWLGHDHLHSVDWGFSHKNTKLFPIMTDRAPAPNNLLQIVTWGCKNGCSTARCSCVKHGLNCSSACSRLPRGLQQC